VYLEQRDLSEQYDAEDDEDRSAGLAGEPSARSSVAWVAFCTTLMALASGLGAVPFFIVRHVDRKWLGVANALASGVMMAASFGLIKEGLDQAAQSATALWRCAQPRL
jgi:hypothetical protein